MALGLMAAIGEDTLVYKRAVRSPKIIICSTSYISMSNDFLNDLKFVFDI
jgi:hypothetical protein